MEDQEWLFDYFHTIFRSPQWDSVVMSFIDENCACFDHEEENKHAHFSLHDEFKELVELLIESCLAEVGISTKGFYDAIESARFARDINNEVYEQLMALDDFITFKKLMVKRNMELELEAEEALSRALALKRSATVSDVALSRTNSSEDFGHDDELEDSGKPLLEEPLQHIKSDRQGDEKDDYDSPTHCRYSGVSDHFTEESKSAQQDSSIDMTITTLPPIRRGSSGWSKPKSLSALSAGKYLAETKEEQKPQEGVSQDDIEKRTQHLRDMRDRILSKRRQEREMAAEHGERLTPQVQPEAKHAPQKTTEELEADKKRAELRHALARQMKADLLQQQSVQ